jgi:hypothetical protein
MTVFWDDARYSLIDNDQRFRGSYYILHQGDENGYSGMLRRVVSQTLTDVSEVITTSFIRAMKMTPLRRCAV